MNWTQAVTLGLVQGLTEFVPVSSSAHVAAVGRLFGSDPGSAFTAITQLGTEAAVLLYFRDDIAGIITQWTRSVGGAVPPADPDARLGWFIIAGSLPIGGLGYGLRRFITGPLRNPWMTCGMLLGFTPVIAYADRRATTRSAHKGLADLSVGDALAFGLWQSLALIPGVSRSGGTIAGGLLLGYSREAATTYSFLLAIPAVLAAGLQQLFDISTEDQPPAWGPIAASTTVSFGIGYAVIAWLLRYVSTNDLRPFVRYRTAAALALFALRVRDGHREAGGAC
ncbi:undecaprenyl-diphosphate phosphatase [Gephyromycinifex aptenodytis]|uniref:undecaprenyl-diphosphate phosphatase n=1 Tax=Gephyromycinifex aptenodytis TaxID=2716227 RepID=UPI0014470A09|nr:undecaprenyl-diphosphate phosphatase [Gephyromycinifex aptenodytis]